MTYLPYTGIGSRDTPEPVLKKMRACSKRLKELGFTLRSGGAKGADSAFECQAGQLAEIYLPFNGFNGKRHDGDFYITAPFLASCYEAMQMASEYHPNWGACNERAKQMHTRNVYQILGANLDSPTLFVVCWTKDGKASGGTGQAMRIAKAYDVPIFNLYFDNALESLGEWLTLDCCGM